MREFLKSMILSLRGLLLKAISPFLYKGKCVLIDEPIHRILIIRIDGIGDMVLTLPAIKALRQRFPSARITVMTTQTTKDLFQGVSYVDEVIVYTKGMDVRALQVDLLFDFLDDYPLTTAMLAYSIKARYRVGFDVKGRGAFFNIKVSPPRAERHYVDAMLDLVAAVGARADERHPELVVNQEGQEGVAQFLRRNNIGREDVIVSIHPGGTNWTSRWLPQRFAQVADHLAQRLHAKVIFIGAESDSNFMDEIKSTITSDVVFFIDQPLRNVIALIQKSNLLIGNNSGMLHIAGAVQTPTVSMMGPSLPKKWWPFGDRNIVLRKDLPCIGCGKGYCRTHKHECMTLITVDEVLKAVNNQLRG